MKKIVSMVLATLVVLMLGIVPAYAEEGPATGTDGPQGEMRPGGGSGRQRPMEGGTPPELPEGLGGRMPGGRDEGPMGMLDTEAVKEAIAGVDADSQETLTSLLAAYEAALEAQRALMDKGPAGDMTDMESARAAMEEAWTALETALAELGINLSGYTLIPEGFDITAPTGGSAA